MKCPGYRAPFGSKNGSNGEIINDIYQGCSASLIYILIPRIFDVLFCKDLSIISSHYEIFNNHHSTNQRLMISLITSSDLVL